MRRSRHRVVPDENGRMIQCGDDASRPVLNCLAARPDGSAVFYGRETRLQKDKRIPGNRRRLENGGVVKMALGSTQTNLNQIDLRMQRGVIRYPDSTETFQQSQLRAILAALFARFANKQR